MLDYSGNVFLHDVLGLEFLQAQWTLVSGSDDANDVLGPVAIDHMGGQFFQRVKFCSAGFSLMFLAMLHVNFLLCWSSSSSDSSFFSLC